MTHQLDTELLTTVMQLLTKEGTSGFVEGLRLLVNEAMVAERTGPLLHRPWMYPWGVLPRCRVPLFPSVV